MGNLVTDARLALEDRNATITIFAVSMSIKYPTASVHQACKWDSNLQFPIPAPTLFPIFPAFPVAQQNIQSFRQWDITSILSLDYVLK